MANNKSGVIFVKTNGRQVRAKGNFTLNSGGYTNTSVMGADGRRHGVSQQVRVAYIEGTISDASDVDVDEVTTIDGETATVELNNGKVFVLSNANYAGTGDLTTQEGEINFRLEGDRGEYINA